MCCWSISNRSMDTSRKRRSTSGRTTPARSVAKLLTGNWYHLVLTSFCLHPIFQKVLGVKNCLSIPQKAPGLRLRIMLYSQYFSRHGMRTRRAKWYQSLWQDDKPLSAHLESRGVPCWTSRQPAIDVRGFFCLLIRLSKNIFCLLSINLFLNLYIPCIHSKCHKCDLF